MRNLIFLFILILSAGAQALPVLNDNVSTYKLVTIYPDHVDPNRFYVAPNYMGLELDAKGVPLFSYIEYQKTRTMIYAKVQSVLIPLYHDEDLKAATAEILKKTPGAKFSSIPFVNSKVVFGSVLKDLVTSEDCDHKAGMIGDEQTCSFELNETGRLALRQLFQKRLTMTMQFEYSVEGVAKQADGKFVAATRSPGISGHIGGGELAPYPQLFQFISTPARTGFSWDQYH